MVLLLAAMPAQGQIINEPFRDGNLPAGWAQSQVLLTTAAGGYANFTTDTAFLTSPVLDLSNYTGVTLSYSVAKFGSGGDGPLTIQVSNDGGATWTAQTFNSSVPTSATYINDGPIPITVTGSAVRIRFIRTASPSQKRLRDIVLNGTLIGGNPCSITGISFFAMSACNDNGTPLSTADDFFTAEVTIDYVNRPSTGNLILSGPFLGSSISISIDSIGTQSHIFGGLIFPANGQSVSLSAVFSADGACSLTNPNAGNAPGPCSVVPDCTLPFFSEYIEGTGNNKCLEIYNPTSSPINLAAAGYRIRMYFNGNPNPTLTINLNGVIPAGGVYIVCNSGAAANFLQFANQTNAAGWYNGNDAVSLETSDGIIDVIGQIGFDPGAAWSSGGVSTLDRTLRRYNFIKKGDNNGGDPFFPGQEWVSFPVNTFNGLGYHFNDCSSLPSGWATATPGCPSGSTSFSNGTWTQNSNCFNSAAGADDLTFALRELCGDGEIVAQYQSVTPFGFAGLMMRENASASSKYVWMFMRANNNASWAIRSVTGGAPQIDQRPHLNRMWMKLTRNGTVFRGFLSTNGVNWQMVFQSSLSMDACLLVGLATHSNVDGNPVSSSFRNVSVNSMGFTLAGAVQDNAMIEGMASLEMQEDLPAQPAFGGNATGFGEQLAVWPNPASSVLEVSIPTWETDGQIHLQINDMQGRPLIYRRIDGQGNRLSLDVSALSAGVYLLSVRSGERLEITRFVKQ